MIIIIFLYRWSNHNDNNNDNDNNNYNNNNNINDNNDVHNFISKPW